MKRLSKLQPLTPSEARDLAYGLCVFFYPAYLRKYREELGLPPVSGQFVPPLSIADFLQWKAQHGEDVISRLNQLRVLVGALLRAGMLIHAGTRQDGIPFFAEHYYFAHELSRLESKGKLWLGNALGAPYIAHELRSCLALITVRTPEGDASIGTGLLVDEELIVTCQHVLKNMTLESVTVQSEELAVLETRLHEAHDVAAIRVHRFLEPPLPDLAFRDARLLEEVVIAGYPTVPRSLCPTVVYQRGEICAELPETQDGSPVLLFSAIARPGNSGGPIVTLDGRIVGLVARSLERHTETTDHMKPFPFFAAVPAATVVECIRDLFPDNHLPWEDYA